MNNAKTTIAADSGTLPGDSDRPASRRNPAFDRPIAVNFHIWPKCNLSCTFCYATFPQARRTLPLDDALAVIDRLVDAGTEKITFVGGEPTLYPHLGEVVRHAADRGLTTCIVSNGARLGRVLDAVGDSVHWVGLSVDSADEGIQKDLGRGAGDHVARSVAFADLVHARGIGLKLNTVVTSLNWREDMGDLVRRMRPDRWKAFQVLRIEDENAGRVEPLLIRDEQFRAFASRHAHLAAEGFPLVAETNDDIRGSYAMIDPLGRFFGNAEGRSRTSAPILEVGVDVALAQAGWRSDKFLARGGLYDWAGVRTNPPATVAVGGDRDAENLASGAG